MEYRKIIEFGKSSYVVSLPKPWLNAKKLKKGDACFKLRETLLGFLMQGGSGNERTVAVPADKFGRYVKRLRKALDQKSHWITFSEFQNTSARGASFSASRRLTRPVVLVASVSYAIAVRTPVRAWYSSRMGSE